MPTGKLKWDEEGTKEYQTGVSKGVLYVWDDTANSGKGAYGAGVSWSGLTAVNENPSGAEATALYADNIKYLNLISAENFAATIEAYDYPDAFEECDGSKSLIAGLNIGQQTRKKFAFCYRTELGNDTQGTAHGYKLHIIYGCTAATSARNYQTVNESPEAITFSWEVSTAPITVTISNKTYTTAHVEIDSTKVSSAAMAIIEDTLYGKDADTSSSTTATDATLMTPESIYSAISSNPLSA